jgi:hypothetical protein
MRVPVSICPACGAENDGASEIGGKGRPSPGDASVCLSCGHLAVFREDMRLRDPTVTELEAMRKDTRIALVLRVRHEMFGDK